MAVRVGRENSSNQEVRVTRELAKPVKWSRKLVIDDDGGCGARGLCEMVSKKSL